MISCLCQLFHHLLIKLNRVKMWPTHTDIDELKHTIQEAALETQYN